MSIKNTFPIDLKEIERILNELNVENLSDFHSLMNEVLDFPEEIDNETNLKKAYDLLKEIQKIAQNFKKARLEDGKSFKEATKVLEKFYKQYEVPLKENISRLQEQISDFINKSEAAQKSESKLFKNPFSRAEEPLESNIDINLRLNREWAISKIDIKKLDLEALRFFFSEYQLTLAINKYLKSNNPKLKGVEFSKKVKI